MPATLLPTLALLAAAPAHAFPVNPSFDDGLTGWTIVEAGGVAAPGVVLAVPEGARMLEGDSFVVQLEQTFLAPPRWASLEITVRQDPGFDLSSSFIPDVFEASLLDSLGVPLVAPWAVGATTSFNLQEDGAAHLGAGATWDGLTFSLPTWGVAPGTPVRLVLHLVGGDGDLGGGVTIEGVSLDVVNQPPVADAGDDRAAECNEPFTLDATASLDADGDALSFRWTDADDAELGLGSTLTQSLPVGDYTFTAEVTDLLGVTDADDVAVQVRDTRPPTLTPVAAATVESDATCTAAVPDLSQVAVDSCATPAVTQLPAPGERAPLGVTDIVLTATDPSGNEASIRVPLTVLDSDGGCLIIADTGDSAIFIDTDETDPPIDTDETDPPVDTDETDPPIDTDETDPPIDTDETDETDTLPPETGAVDTLFDTLFQETDVDTDPDSDPDTDPPVDTDTLPSESDPPADDTDLVPPVDDTDDSDELETDKGGTDGPTNTCGCASSGGSGGAGLVGAAMLLAALRRRRAVALAAALPGVAAAQEPTPIALGAVASGAIDTSDEVERWQFTAAPGAAVYIDQTASSNPFGLNWSLTDAWGRVIKEDTNDLSDLGRVALMGGVYTIAVRSESTGTGTYSFVVREVADRTAAITPGVRYDGNLTAPGMIESFTLTLPASRGFAELNTFIRPDLNWTMTDVLGLGVFGWTFSLDDTGPTDLVGGDYTLSVRGEGEASGTYGFTFWLPQVIEHGAAGAGFTGELAIPGEVHRWTWDIPTPGLYTVRVVETSNFPGLNLRLRDPLGAPILSSFNLGDELRLSLGQGPHTLEIVGEGASIGTFTLALMPVVDTTAPLTLGVDSTAAFAAPGQRARYTFNAAPGQRLWFDPTSASVFSHGWRLTDAHGSEVVPLTTDVALRGPYVLQGGAYTLEIVPENATTTSVVFQLRDPVDVTTPLSLGAPASHALTGAAATHRYTFTVPANRVVDLVVSATSNRFGLNATLTDAAGRAVFGRTTELSTSRGLALVGGSYTLTIQGEGENVGSWTLQLDDVGPATPPAAAATIASGAPQSGAVSSGAPVRYGVTLAAPTAAYFDLTTGNSVLDWALYDPAGRAVFGPTDARDPNLHDQGPHNLAAGAYVLELLSTGTATPFGFTWHAVPADVATPTALATLNAASFTVPGQTQSWTFNLPSAANLYFDLRSGAGATTWSLRDGVGQERVAPVRALFTSDDIGPIRLGPGDWTVLVDPANDDTPVSTFVVDTVDQPSESVAWSTPVTATVTRPGSTWTGTVNASGGELAYFDLTATAASWAWTLRDPYGQARFTDVSMLSSNDDLGPIPLVPGTWTVEINPIGDRVGAAGFTATRPIGVSRTANLDVPIADALAGPGDTHTWAFSLASDQEVFFDTLVGAAGLTTTLVDAAGHAILDVPSLSSTSNDYGPYTLRAGDYALHLKSDRGATSAYEIVLRTVTRTSELVALGDTVVDAITSPGSTHSYVLDVPVDGAPVFFDVVTSPVGVWWKAVDPVGQAVFDLVRPSDPSSDQGPIPLAAGSYTVTIDPDGDATASWNLRFATSAPDAPRFYYTRYSGIVRVKRAAWVLDDGLELGIIEDIATPPGADGLIVAPDGDIVVGGQGAFVYKINPETGAFQSASTGGGGSYHVALDPSGTKVWTSGQPGTVSEIPIVPLGDGFTHTLTGDDRSITHLAFDRTGQAWYTASASFGFGSFGRIDLATKVTTQVLRSLPAAHGIAFDPYTDTMILTGATHVTQVDIATGTIVADFDIGPGYIMDQGTVDGAGHLFAADNNGHLVFIDYAATGRVDDPTNYVLIQYLDSNLDDVAPMSWLGSPCAGGPPIRDLRPAQGTRLAVGATPLLSGKAVPVDPTRPIAAVLVDGSAATVDAVGQFFAPLTIAAGEQTVTIEAIDRCGRTRVDLRLTGADDADATGETLTEVSASLMTSFADTTWAEAADRLLVDAWGTVTADTPVSGPLYLAVGADLDPRATLSNPAGVTDDGLRYVEAMPGGQLLQPGETTPRVPLAFDNPERAKLEFTPRWLSSGDAPPSMVSSPITSARAGSPWVYQARAVDPEGLGLTWSLPEAPGPMTVDGDGTARWTPSAADVGTWQVRLRATDALGNAATQAFTLLVHPADLNRPPGFASVPVTTAAVGAAWRYAAEAVDPDGDAITFRLTEHPAGMTLDGAGVAAWPFALPGLHGITLEADDGRGGVATQAFTLAVGEVSINPAAPQITSSPPTLASVAGLYLYQPSASDPDGDSLVWALDQGPVGMNLDVYTGRLLWTPSEDQLGAHAVTLRADDGRGGYASQAWTVEVYTSPPDRAPIFSTVAPSIAVLGLPLVYDAEALDPEFGEVRYAIATGPGVVDPVTGVLTWTPTTAGTFTLGLTATDPAGNAASQVFLVRVRTEDTPPDLTTDVPDDVILVGQTWQIDLHAIDPDGDRLTWSLDAAPPGATIDARTGAVTWTPTAPTAGGFTAAVADELGNVDRESWVLIAEVDGEAPLVAITVEGTACAGEEVRVCVSASDAGGVDARALAVDGAERELDALGCVRLTEADAGLLPLLASATDRSGNIGSEALALPFIDCDNPTAPTVTLTSPAPGAVLEGPTPVVIAVDDDAPLGLAWEVQVSRRGADDWRTLASGDDPVDGEVGLVDTTLLAAGDWDLRVFATDGVNTNDTRAWFGVTDAFKPGRFDVAFTDAAVTLRGLSLSINRRYDSLAALAGEEGDFGLGWSLGLSGAVWDTAAESDHPDPFISMMSNEAFVEGGRVYVQRPDGVTVGFTLRLDSAGSIPFVRRVRFEADAPHRDTLTPDASTTVFTYATGAVFDYFIPWNPSGWTLKTGDGVSYTYDEDEGLTHVEDAFGNTIDVRPDGLFHSEGPAVRFTRDAADRIRTITLPDDPADGLPAAVTTYDYNPDGTLRAVTSPTGVVRSYRYDGPPGLLTDILDPTGVVWVATVYDADGRVTAHCPAGADRVTLVGCQTLDFDPSTRVETSHDAAGNAVIRVFSAAGDVTREDHVMDDGSLNTRQWTWDDAHHETTETVGGQTWVRAYNPRGDLISETDPDGVTRTWTFNDLCDDPIQATDGAGSTWTWTLDENCQLVEARDPLGGVTTYAYNLFGDVTAITDGNGDVWTFGYDDDGQAAWRTDPQGHTVSWTWWDTGTPRSETDRLGNVRTFTFDADSRPLTEVWNGGERTITWTWDRFGKLASIADPDVTLSYGWHPTGKLAWEVQAPTGGPSTRFDLSYNATERLSRVADDSGAATDWTYDALGRPTSATWTLPGQARAVTQAWDDLDRMTTVTRFADAAATAPVVQTGYEFARAGDAFPYRRVNHRRADGTAVQDIQLDITPIVDNLTGWTDSEGAHTITQDGVGHLLAVDHPPGPQPDETWAYDRLGARTTSHLTSTSVTGDDLGEGGARLRQDDTWDWRWDDDGRLIERTTRATGEALRLTWDVRDRLTGIDDVAAGGAVRHTLRFTYDPLDRRVSETLDGVTTWRFHHAGNTVLEKASDGSATVRRLYGQGLDQILAEADAAGVRWLLTDQVGTVRDVVNDAGVVLAHLVYDSFGRELSGVSPSALGFAARPATALGGFIDLRARFYDPASGRFLSADPMPPFSEAFVAGNPLLMRDPTGKSVAIEFACQVVHAIGNVISFASMFLSAIAMLDYVADQVAAAFADALGTQAAPGHGSAAISAALAFIKPLIGTAGKLCKLRALANPKTPPKLGRKLVEWDHTTYHKLPRR